MVKDGIWVAAGGLRQSAETGNARAETLGPDGGQQTWKPGPGGAAGLTDAKESTQNLFRMKMAGPGGRAGAGLGAWARRLAGRAQGRCARRGRLREQRQGDGRSRVRRRRLRGIGRWQTTKTQGWTGARTTES